MTDRVLVYPGALPQDTDILNTNLFHVIGQAFLNAAVIGPATSVAGLACTATSPASLTVNISAGSIYQLDEVDASSYGSLGVNTGVIVKQGILSSAQSLNLSAPATTGFSQNYLVQATLQDVDSGPSVLSYYNSTNPSQPYSGPANSGSSQMTIRQCKCAVALKAGVPATAGSQTTPSPDAGYVGLYVITVSNGASQIVSNNISQISGAPFFPTLPQVPYQVQQGQYIYAGQDTGVANAYVITFAPGQPIPAAYTPGMEVKFKAQNSCTGASTINIQGLGAVSIRRGNGVALAANDIVSGGLYELTYDGTFFQMTNYQGSGANTNTSTAVNIPYVADTGTQNNVIATYSPAITSGQLVAGLTIEVKLSYTITGAATINVSGLGAKPIKTGDLQNPPNGLFVAGQVLLLIFDGNVFQVGNSTSLIYRKPSANTTIYVNSSTGSDTNYDGTSASVVGSGSTAGPFATIGRAMTAAFGYAPSQFSITISVASGVYNEAVATPATAGPSVVIDGGNSAAVTVNGGSVGNAFLVQGPNSLRVQNVTAQCGPSFGCFCANQGGQLTTNNTASNGAGSVFVGDNLGSVTPGTHTFNGSCQALFNANAGGSIIIPTSAQYSFASAIAVSNACAVAASVGVINCPILNPIQWTNPSFVSGKKFDANNNGVIFGAAASNFPGATAGTTETGGQAN